MPLAVMVVCFVGVVLFALYRRKNVSVSMSIRPLFQFTIDAKDAQDTPRPSASKTVGPVKTGASRDD
jgi:type IV secretory pathway TrbL component